MIRRKSLQVENYRTEGGYVECELRRVIGDEPNDIDPMFHFTSEEIEEIILLLLELRTHPVQESD